MVIKISNFKDFDILHYALPLILGSVNNVASGTLFAKNETNASFVIWPVVKGKFKLFLQLCPGVNVIILKCNKCTFRFRLEYKPLESSKFIRLVYIICSESDGKFQAPHGEDNSVQSACNRISVAMQMLQTFTVEKLKSQGLGAKTFRLEESSNAKPICHVFQSKMVLNDALKFSELELWEYFALELMNSNLRDKNNCKFLAILSCTQYENTLFEIPQNFKQARQLTKGYAALASGGLALLGSACLHTWPSTLQEIPWRFGDDRKIDSLYFMDDSCNRGFFWACFSTTLGAMLHELGHIFDLGHTLNGIMSRGFDNIYKFFIIDIFYCSHLFQKKYNPFYQKQIHEKHHNVKMIPLTNIAWSTEKPKSEQPNVDKTGNRQSMSHCNQKSIKDNKTQITQNSKMSHPINDKTPWRVLHPPEQYVFDDSESDWARSSAVILAYHKWFNDFEDENETKIKRDGWTFSSDYGICIVEFRDENGTAFHHLEFLSDEPIIEVNLNEYSLAQHVPENVKEIKAHIQDRKGNILQHTFNYETMKK